MEVFLSKKQAKQTKDPTSLRREFGKAGDEIADCLNVLKAVDTLQELLSMPPALNHRCHELHKNLKDTFSMVLSTRTDCSSVPQIRFREGTTTALTTSMFASLS